MFMVLSLFYRFAVNVIGYVTLPAFWISHPYKMVCGGPDIGSSVSGNFTCQRDKR